MPIHAAPNGCFSHKLFYTCAKAHLNGLTSPVHTTGGIVIVPKLKLWVWYPCRQAKHAGHARLLCGHIGVSQVRNDTEAYEFNLCRLLNLWLWTAMALSQLKGKPLICVVTGACCFIPAQAWIARGNPNIRYASVGQSICLKHANFFLFTVHFLTLMTICIYAGLQRLKGAFDNLVRASDYTPGKANESNVSSRKQLGILRAFLLFCSCFQRPFLKRYCSERKPCSHSASFECSGHAVRVLRKWKLRKRWKSISSLCLDARTVIS